MKTENELKQEGWELFCQKSYLDPNTSYITRRAFEAGYNLSPQTKDTKRLNYIEKNFHVLGFTRVSYGWVCIYNDDTREADNMRDMIDLMSME